jgi:hypothetical protein
MRPLGLLEPEERTGRPNRQLPRTAVRRWVEVWKSNNCIAHLSAEARQLWGQLREDWTASS